MIQSHTKNLLLIMVLIFAVLSTSYAERKVFTFSADTTFANLGKGKELTVLRGNAVVTADDVRINAGEVTLFGDDFQFAQVDGNFSAVDLKNDFSLEGNRLFYDRSAKLLRAEGNIVMKDKKNEVIIRAHFLESKNDGDFMVVQLGVRITKKDELSARTEFLTYYRKTEILEMTGFPYALWKDDEYRADRVSINLDTDEVNLEGKVQGFISTVQGDNKNAKKDTKDTNGTSTNGTTGTEGKTDVKSQGGESTDGVKPDPTSTPSTGGTGGGTPEDKSKEAQGYSSTTGPNKQETPSQ